jgi:hypothetical protein
LIYEFWLLLILRRSDLSSKVPSKVFSDESET